MIHEYVLRPRRYFGSMSDAALIGTAPHPSRGPVGRKPQSNLMSRRTEMIGPIFPGCLRLDVVVDSWDLERVVEGGIPSHSFPTVERMVA